METANNCMVAAKSDGIFTIRAGGKTDFFIDYRTDVNISNAPFYYDYVDYDFEIKVCVRPEFANTYDAGAILIYDDDKHWIKAAFENTDLGYHSVVAVVTNEVSDDSNGEFINQEKVYIRVLRKDDYFCIHHSTDGNNWKMVRYFRQKFSKKLKIGVIAQSPVGNGCDVEYCDLKISKNEYLDIRKGK
jgi:regulation of enolase protein 1 (concanavalin A-like superfamily)